MSRPFTIAAGDVLEVQLTSETVIFERGDGTSEHNASNRMRLFVRDLEGKERKFDFEETQLGVRTGQRIAVVQGQTRSEPVTLMLFNLSAGEDDTFETNLRAFLDVRSWFSPPLQTLAATVIYIALFWLIARFGFGRSEGFANVYSVVSAALLAPAFWWAATTWERLSHEWRYNAARKRLISDARGRVRVYAPDTATTA